MAPQRCCAKRQILLPAWPPWYRRRACSVRATTASLRRITGCVNKCRRPSAVGARPSRDQTDSGASRAVRRGRDPKLQIRRPPAAATRTTGPAGTRLTVLRRTHARPRRWREPSVTMPTVWPRKSGCYATRALFKISIACVSWASSKSICVTKRAYFGPRAPIHNPAS